MPSMESFKRIFGLQQIEKAVMDLDVGQRYQQLDGGMTVWVVDRINRISGVQDPLVRLHREDHPDIEKTLSSSVLGERDNFRLYLDS